MTKVAKRKSKVKTQAQKDEIEADRLAAHEGGISDSAGHEIMEISLTEMDEPTILTVEEVIAEESEQDAHMYKADENPREEMMADAESDMEGDAAPMEGVEEPKDRVSIVKDKFKAKYIENARAQGIPGKAAKRSNWDWLSQQLAAACLNDKAKIEIGSFTDILDANGVDHSSWTNKNKGWEGRFRMTGRVALQKVVANAGFLKLPGGTELEAPTDWCAIYKTKS